MSVSEVPYLQQFKVVHTVVDWDHHELGKNVLDGLLEAFCNRLHTHTHTHTLKALLINIFSLSIVPPLCDTKTGEQTDNAVTDLTGQ